jgi:hypothetical protein
MCIGLLDGLVLDYSHTKVFEKKDLRRIPTEISEAKTK